MNSRPMRQDGAGPSPAAAALVGLLSLAVAWSPPCAGPTQHAEPSVPAAPGAQQPDAGAAATVGVDGGMAESPVVRAAGVVAGQILGANASGAVVTLAGSGVWPPRTLRLGSSGQFRFSDVPEGVYSVSARHGSRVAEPRGGLWLRRAGHVYLALRLEQGAVLFGHVLRASDGAPIANAELMVSPDSLSLAPRHARTDASGGFRLEGLLARPQRLSASARGYVPLSSVEVRPGGALELRLTAAATVSGVVYDALDHPVEGARVEVLASAQPGLSAVIGGPVADFTQGSNLGTTAGPIPPISQASRSSPRPGDALAAEQSPWLGAGGPSALTDAEGHFTLEGVPPGRFTLLATHADHAPGTLATPRLRAGQELTDQLVVLPDGSLVHGRVLDSRGFPAADVPLILRAEREPLPRMLVTGRDGSFQFEHVLGVASLTANAPGLPERRERLDARASGEIELELDLEDAYITLEGRVVDEAGFPRAGAEVLLRSLRYQAPMTRVTFSASDGSFHFPGLPAPPWTLEASLTGCVDAQRTLNAAPSAAIDIALREAGELRMLLHSDFDDAPLLGASVRVVQAGHRYEAQTSSPAGAYVVRGLDQGALTLHVEAPNHLSLERTLELRPRTGAALELDLGVLRLTLGGSVEGDVRDMHGAPVSGATIWLNGVLVPGVQTDAAGHFVLLGIAPDTYHIGSVHARAGEAERPQAVTVYANQTTPGADIRLPGAISDDAQDSDVGEPRRASGVAVRVETRDGHVVITAIGAGSAASAAGLRVEDVLLSVDQVPVSFAGQARSALRGLAGEAAVLSIRRAGRTRRVVVRRERYSMP